MIVQTRGRRHSLRVVDVAIPMRYHSSRRLRWMAAVPAVAKLP